MDNITLKVKCEECGREDERHAHFFIPGVRGVIISHGEEYVFIDPTERYVCPKCVVHKMFEGVESCG